MSIFKRLVYLTGHRGAFLAFLALLDVLYGYSLFANPGPTAHVSYIFPLKAWGVIWVITGLILLTGVLTRHDRFQFSLAATVKAVWAAAWVDAWMTSGYSRSWVNFVIWAAFAALVVVVSFWPESASHHVEPVGKEQIKQVVKEQIDIVEDERRHE